eukprot:6177838-Pleurochrysis_carterae.AAC.1
MLNSVRKDAYFTPSTAIRPTAWPGSARRRFWDPHAAQAALSTMRCVRTDFGLAQRNCMLGFTRRHDSTMAATQARRKVATEETTWWAHNSHV